MGGDPELLRDRFRDAEAVGDEQRLEDEDEDVHELAVELEAGG